MTGTTSFHAAHALRETTIHTRIAALLGEARPVHAHNIGGRTA